MSIRLFFRQTLVVVAFTLLTFNARAELRYTLAASQPQSHYLELTLDYAPAAGATSTDFKLPVWTPGSYLVREFAKHLEGFQATSNGTALNWEKTDKNTWRVQHAAGAPVQLKYKLYAFEPSVRTNFVDARHGFATGASTFLYVAGAQQQPVTVAVQLPRGWTKVSTTLAAVPGAPNTFRAADYDELVDSPLEMGTQREFSFQLSGVKHRVAMVGEGMTYDSTLLARQMRQVCEEAGKVFGELPVTGGQYLFIVHNQQSGGGGLEHKNGCVLDVSRTTYTPEGGGSRGFLELVAHEYFHLWNVKRLRPIALGPFDYDHENYTHMLWVAEGFTAYYDNLIVERAGLVSKDDYLKALAGSIASVENSAGRAVQPVAEASWDAWIKYYRPNENSGNTTVSYYTSGSLLAMVFDAQIAAHSKGKQNLDDLMRYVYQKYYKEQGRGYTDDEFHQAVSEFTGRDQTEFFRESIYGAKPVDWNAALNLVGYQLTQQPDQPDTRFVGANFTGNGTLVVRSLRRDSPAWTGGLNVGDEVLAINGQPVASTGAVGDVIKATAPGSAITLDIRRDGLPQQITLTPTPAETHQYTIESLSKLSKDQKKAREAWL